MPILLIAIIGQSVGIITLKYIITVLKVNSNKVITIAFIFWSLAAAFSLPWLGSFKQEISVIGFGLLILIAGIAAISKKIELQVLGHEDTDRYESIILFIPLVTALVAAGLFPEERNPNVLVATLIASIALIVPHIKKRHLDICLDDKLLMATVLMIAVENSLIKLAVDHYSPALLFVLRGLLAGTLLFIFLRPRLGNVDLKFWWWSGLAAIFGGAYKVAEFTGIEQFGITYTVLVLMIAPFFILLLSKIWLREKVHSKYIISMVIIIGSIIFASWSRFFS